MDNKKLGRNFMIGVALCIVIAAVVVVVLVDFTSREKEKTKTQGVQIETTETESTLVQRYDLDEDGAIVIPDATVVILPDNVPVEDEYEWAEYLLRQVQMNFASEFELHDLQPYIAQVIQVDNETVNVLVDFENTDLEVLAETKDYEHWTFEGITNKYGTDYPIVYWDELPENTLQWYDVMYEQEIDGEYRGVVQSSSQCTITNCETGEDTVLFK